MLGEHDDRYPGDPEVGDELEAELEGEHSEEEMFLIGLVQELESKKERAVQHKAAIEARWIEDERQYWGFRQADIDEEAGEDEPPPVDNKTGEKVELAAARIGDMLFPTNDANWSFKPPQDPEDIRGEPVDAETARTAVRGAEKEVQGWLNDCQYPKHGRQAIHDSCRLGAGVLKGPYPRFTTKRVMRAQLEPIIDDQGQQLHDPTTGEPLQREVLSLQIQKATTPAVARVDPWMFFPGKCRSMEECSGAFEMHLYSHSRVVQLAQHEGFIKDRVRELASMSPAPSEYESSLLDARDSLLRADSSSEREDEFVVWEYHGPIEPDLLHALGALEPQGEPDPLDTYWGEVWFSQGVPLKAELTAVIGDERVPYYVVPYRRDEADIINSYGIPRIMRDSQRTIDITWEAMVHNAKVTAGPQTIYWEGKAIPSSGSYTVRAPQAWKVTDRQVKKLDDVIQFVNIQSTLPQIQPLYDMAKQNANDETQLPMIAQGEAAQPGGQQTWRGTQMVMNSQNIVQRKFAHAYDDEVTIPLLTRFYWWLMMYGEDDSLKVDMSVDPRGASYLLVKDMQAQHMMTALQMTTADANLQRRVHMDRLYRRTWATMDIPVDDLFKSDEEMEGEGPTPQEQMQQAVAEAEVRKAQAEATTAEAEAEESKAKIERMHATGGVDPESLIQLEREQIQAEVAAADREVELIIAQMKRDEAIAKAASDRDVKIADIQAKMQINERDRQMKAALEAAKERREAAQARADQFIKGMELRRQIRQDNLKERNLEAGHDTY